MTVPKGTPTFNDDPGAFDEDAISENDALNATDEEPNPDTE